MIDRRAFKIVESIRLLKKPDAVPVPYEEPLDYFTKSAVGVEGEILLDSGGDFAGKGSCSIACLNPAFIVRVKGGTASLKSRDGEFSFEAAPRDVIEWLAGFIGAASNGNRSNMSAPPTKDCFDGGLIFLLSYELNRYYEKRPSLDRRGMETDDLWCAFYPAVRIFDHTTRTARAVTYSGEEPVNAASATSVDMHYDCSGFECDEPRGMFVSKIEKVKRYIEAGDVYQVNISRRLEAEFHGCALGFYRDLRKTNPAAFGAFVNGGDFQLLSLSPELFFSVRGGVIETRPIKGTAPRGADLAADYRLREALVNSEKERAENLMIVDLMRNDLSKICRPHSVKVPKLFTCETLPTVHHLVSTVRGELHRGDAKLSRILDALFPGGSVTGAPKLRAMEIIAEMESSPRGFYCGSLAALGLNGTVTASLLIRTVTINRAASTAIYRTGGGITAGSDPQDEFEETRHKAAMLGAAAGGKAVFADVR